MSSDTHTPDETPDETPIQRYQRHLNELAELGERDRIAQMRADIEQLAYKGIIVQLDSARDVAPEYARVEDFIGAEADPAPIAKPKKKRRKHPTAQTVLDLYERAKEADPGLFLKDFCKKKRISYAYVLKYRSLMKKRKKGDI